MTTIITTIKHGVGDRVFFLDPNQCCRVLRGTITKLVACSTDSSAYGSGEWVTHYVARLDDAEVGELVELSADEVFTDANNAFDALDKHRFASRPPEPVYMPVSFAAFPLPPVGGAF
jgi:hypothetical protein